MGVNDRNHFQRLLHQVSSLSFDIYLNLRKLVITKFAVFTPQRSSSGSDGIPVPDPSRTFFQVPDPSRPEVKNPYPSDPDHHIERGAKRSNFHFPPENSSKPMWLPKKHHTSTHHFFFFLEQLSRHIVSYRTKIYYVGTFFPKILGIQDGFIVQ